MLALVDFFDRQMILRGDQVLLDYFLEIRVEIHVCAIVHLI